MFYIQSIIRISFLRLVRFFSLLIFFLSSHIQIPVRIPPVEEHRLNDLHHIRPFEHTYIILNLTAHEILSKSLPLLF